MAKRVKVAALPGQTDPLAVSTERGAERSRVVPGEQRPILARLQVFEEAQSSDGIRDRNDSSRFLGLALFTSEIERPHPFALRYIGYLHSSDLAQPCAGQCGDHWNPVVGRISFRISEHF